LLPPALNTTRSLPQMLALGAPKLGLRKFNGPRKNPEDPFSLPLNCLRQV